MLGLKSFRISSETTQYDLWMERTYIYDDVVQL